MFSQNVMQKYGVVNNIVTVSGNDKHTVQRVGCEMTFRELIEQLDCEKRANTWHPWNLPDCGYPRKLIGIQQLLPCGTNQFRLGSKIALADFRANSKIEDLWPDTVGQAGGSPPVWIVRLPV